MRGELHVHHEVKRLCVADTICHHGQHQFAVARQLLRTTTQLPAGRNLSTTICAVIAPGTTASSS